MGDMDFTERCECPCRCPHTAERGRELPPPCPDSALSFDEINAAIVAFPPDTGGE